MMYIIHSVPKQHVLAGIPAVFREILLQEYKSINVVNCVTITPKQLKL
jgi:hypothetical protein